MTNLKGRRFAWPVAFAVLVLVATIALIDVSDLAWSHGFIQALQSQSPTGPRPPLSIGDHLQSTYYIWLWLHALATGPHVPWIDPFQFALTGHHTVIVSGWPLILPFAPVAALAGPIAAYNVLVIGGFLAAAACTFLLGRSLGLSRIGATVAGFACAFAPYRLAQSGHVGSILVFLIPLILYLADRALRADTKPHRWGWACAAAYLSLIASGELHFALYGTALFVTFAVVRAIGVPRDRLRSLIAPATALVLGAAVIGGLTYFFTLRVSGGYFEGVSAAPKYAAGVSFIFRRELLGEKTAYVGAVIGPLAVVGFVRAFMDGSRRLLALWLAFIVAVAYALAIAPAHPLTYRLYRLLPFVASIRVSTRALVMAVIALAVLAGFGADVLARYRNGWIGLLAILALLVFDAKGLSQQFDYTSAGHDVLASVPKDAAVLDLPPFHAGHYGGTRYMLDLMRHPGPRVNGYDVLAPKVIVERQQKATVLTRTPPDPCAWRDAQRFFHFHYVAVHTDLFVDGLWPPTGRPRGPYRGFGTPQQWPVKGTVLAAALDRTPGFHKLAEIDGTTTYLLDVKDLRCR